MELKITCTEKEFAQLIRELQKAEQAEEKVVVSKDKEHPLGFRVGNPAVVMVGNG